MKILLFIVFGIALTVYYVDGLYSQKCKEAETSSDKLVRFIENANCTLVEKNRLFRQGLNHLQSKFQQGFAHLHNQFNGNQPSWNPMNPSADPTQPKLNPTNPTFPNFDPPTTTAPKVNLPVQVYPIDNDRIVNENPTIPGYEGLDHPIDVRMLPDEDAPKANSPTTLRFKRDASSEDDQNEERGKFSYF